MRTGGEDGVKKVVLKIFLRTDRNEPLKKRKFNRKEFNNLMFADPSFREGVLRILKPYYEMLLGPKRTEKEEEDLKNTFGYGSIDLNDF